MNSTVSTLLSDSFPPSEPEYWSNGDSGTGDIFDDTMESIDRWLALANSIPAPVVSDDEWAEMQMRRREDREWELTNARTGEAVAGREKV